MATADRHSPQFSLIALVEPDAVQEDAPLLVSLRSQTTADWEILLVGRDAISRITGAPGVDPVTTPVSPGSLAQTLEAGINSATGTFFGFLDIGSSLPADALTAIASVLSDAPETDVLYTDEVSKDGTVAVLKPVYSPEWLRGQNYFGDLTLFRRSHVSSIGGVRLDVPGAEIYDLVLRAATRARHVARVSDVLCTSPSRATSWGVDDETRMRSTRTVLENHLAETGGGIVNEVRTSGVHDTRRLVHDEPLVSIVIPTRGDHAVVHGSSRCLVVEAVRSVIERTTYRNFEIIVVIDDVAPQQVADDLVAIAGNRVSFVPWSRAFSFSDKMNLGVVHSHGEYLLFLNDDVEVISPEWMTSLLALAQRQDAGMVGAMLYFEDDTIQHAGHAYYRLDVTHIGLNSERGAAGPNGAFLLEREVEGATAACAMLKRSVFFEAGGFSSLLPGNFNDVDLCMKVAVCGYQSYVTPHAELYHFESKSRDPRVARYEIDTTWNRWEPLFFESPHWPEDPHKFYRKVSGSASKP